MQMTITGHHIEITDALREATTNKLNKLEQHFPDIASVDVILTVEKHSQSAEANTHFLGQDLTVKASADDLYAAITDMANKLHSTMQRQKEKVKSHHHSKPEVADETV
jgi:putative sigma-54 modulation protein